MRDREVLVFEIYKIKFVFINIIKVVTLLTIDDNLIETFNNL